MRRTELLKRLANIAAAKGLTLDFVRRGGNHDIYRCGPLMIPVGRHTDIPEPVARKTIREVEAL